MFMFRRLPSDLQESEIAAFVECFSERGSDACKHQETLLQEALKSATPTQNPTKALTLVKCMQDPSGSVLHKLRCAVMISRLDPQAKHKTRASKCIDFMCANPIDNITPALFKAFEQDLTPAQCREIYEKTMTLFSSTEKNNSRTPRALQILALIFPYVRRARDENDEQGCIVDLLLSYLHATAVTTPLRLSALEALANLVGTGEEHRDEIFTALLKIFGDTNKNVSDAIAKTMQKLFADTYQGDETSEAEIIFNKILAAIYNENLNVKYTVIKTLGAMFDDLESEQKKVVIQRVVPLLVVENLTVAVLFALQRFYAEMTDEQQKIALRQYATSIQSKQPGVAREALKAVAQLADSDVKQREALLIALYSTGDADATAEISIAAAHLFTAAFEGTEQDDMITKIVLPAMNANQAQLKNAGIILGAIFEAATDEQKKIMIQPLLDFISGNLLPVTSTALSAAAHYFQFETPSQQDALINNCNIFISGSSLLAEDAAIALTEIHAYASTPQKERISEILITFNSKNHVNSKKQSQTLNMPTIDQQEDALKCKMATLAARSSENTSFHVGVLNTPDTHILAFCRQTLAEVIPKNRVEQGSSSMQKAKVV